MSSRPVRLCVALAAIVALAACGRFGKAGDATTTPTPQSYGKKLKPTKTAEAQTPSGTARLRMVLTDPTGAGIAGAYVRYQGEGRKGTFLTNDRGIATGTVKPGVYKIDVPYCGRDVLINGDAGGRISVSQGITLDVPLQPVDWEWRYAPTPSVIPSRDAPWRSGRPVTLGVKILDNCTFDAAPNRTVTTHAWRFTGAFEGVQSQVRSDGDGFAHVTVECTGRGDGTVVLYDRRNPSDGVDLIEAISGPEDGGPYCR